MTTERANERIGGSDNTFRQPRRAAKYIKRSNNGSTSNDSSMKRKIHREDLSTVWGLTVIMVLSLSCFRTRFMRTTSTIAHEMAAAI